MSWYFSWPKICHYSKNSRQLLLRLWTCCWFDIAPYRELSYQGVDIHVATSNITHPSRYVVVLYTYVCMYFDIYIYADAQNTITTLYKWNTWPFGTYMLLSMSGEIQWYLCSENSSGFSWLHQSWDLAVLQTPSGKSSFLCRIKLAATSPHV